MKTSSFLTGVLAAFGALTLAFNQSSVAEENEERVALSEVPAAVKQTFEENCDINGATIGEVTRDTENGQIVYEAEAVRADGSKIEIEVQEDGTLIEIEADDDDGEEDEDDD